MALPIISILQTLISQSYKFMVCLISRETSLCLKMSTKEIKLFWYILMLFWYILISTFLLDWKFENNDKIKHWNFPVKLNLLFPIFSDIRMFIFELVFILYVLQLAGSNGILHNRILLLLPENSCQKILNGL